MTQATSQPAARKTPRDPRVDFLRGLSLISIFVDHIPHNRLADYTFHNFGFSDAAEIFVILAGFSATMAYGGVFDRYGFKACATKIAARCFKIYGVQIVLILSTLAIVAVWTRSFGTHALIVGPLLRDGFKGALRGVTLEALPTYLDILPLYIVLLAIFPIVRWTISKSPAATLAGSFLLYACSNVLHWNLPNIVDPSAVTEWYFDPFTWQLVFVLGAVLATATRSEAPWLTRPQPIVLALCWAYLAFAFVAVDAWSLWPKLFGSDFPSVAAPFAIFGNEPKTFVTPWRLAHIAALMYVALTSPRLMALARLAWLRPIVASGKHSLEVFAVGCVAALLGRLAFNTFGVSVGAQVVVNAAGVIVMLAVAVALEGASPKLRLKLLRRKRPAIEARA